MADHDDEMLGRELTGGGYDVPDEGAAAEGVQNLRGRRFHAGALTRCEDDDGCRAVGAHGCALRLRGWTPAGYREVSGRKGRRVPSRTVRTRKNGI
ncbi:hypothetical protein GCM10017744_043780 [Streptomyces antimycoticus]